LQINVAEVDSRNALEVSEKLKIVTSGDDVGTDEALKAVEIVAAIGSAVEKVGIDMQAFFNK